MSAAVSNAFPNMLEYFSSINSSGGSPKTTVLFSSLEEGAVMTKLLLPNRLLLETMQLTIYKPRSLKALKLEKYLASLMLELRETRTNWPVFTALLVDSTFFV